MAELLQNIQITNFKSLRSCSIKNCKRINLFIGRPNVGKSNILEALSLFSVPYLIENRTRSLKNLIRVENASELFYHGDSDHAAHVETDRCHARVQYDRLSGLNVWLDMPGISNNFALDENLNIRIFKRSFSTSFIKKYSFTHNPAFVKAHARYLIPPFGSNLLEVIGEDEKLKDEISSWFKESGLRLVFDRASQTLKIMQSGRNGDDVFLIPYNAVADTLQRMIFFKTAIVGNNDSVLLFEEPEAHSYPPFIAKITQEMIYKKDNQYFIATHSPFILNDFLENAREDLAVYMVDYAKNETRVNLLTDDQLREIYQNGVDLILNGESYT